MSNENYGPYDALTGENEDEDGLGSMTGLRNLAQVESNYEDTDRLNPRIRVNKFYSEFNDELDSGKGRDDLVQYVWNQFGDRYDVGEVTDLQIYLLNKLDEEGEMIGKEVFHLVEEFDEADGSPEYLENFDFRLGYQPELDVRPFFR